MSANLADIKKNNIPIYSVERTIRIARGHCFMQIYVLHNTKRTEPVETTQFARKPNAQPRFDSMYGNTSGACK